MAQALACGPNAKTWSERRAGGEVDQIVVWRLDRWGRSLLDLIGTLQELASLNVGFVSLSEALDLTTASGRALAGMLSAAAGSVIWLLTTRRLGVTIAPSRVAGIWTGILETYYCPGMNCRPVKLRLFLHVTADSAGRLHASFDSIDQGVMGFRRAKAALNGNVFSFDLPSIPRSYEATLSPDGNSLKGTWSEGLLPLPLDLARVTTDGSIAGIWEGDYGSCPLRLVLHVTKDATGTLGVSLDSIDDRDPMGAAGTHLVFHANAFSFEIPPDRSYRATLSADGYLKGTWHDTDGAHSVVFTRTTAAAAPTAKAVLTRSRVTLDNLKPILDQELKPALDRGLLSKPTGGGLVIGVVDHGKRRIFAYGTARPDSIFEIGSITKTFTGLVLAQMVVQKKVSLNEPVRALLSPGFAGQLSTHEITLLDLATHHSGLPRDADNLDTSKPSRAYADYDARHLSEFLTRHGLAKHAHTSFLYSNLGFGLLGYALSQRAGVSYAELVDNEITAPLHMRDTVTALSPEQRKRFIQGYDGSFGRAEPMEFNVLQGNGVLKSTASDMLTYLDANLHPQQYAAGAAPGSPLTTLPTAVVLDHESRTDGGPGLEQALAWGINPQLHTLNHGGATLGNKSMAVLDPVHDRALIVLYNRWVDNDQFVDLTDRVSLNLLALLSGEPAIPLDFICEADKRGLTRLGIQ